MFERRTSMAALTVGVAIWSALGCSADERGSVSPMRSALTPGWTPQLLASSTQAWFTAAAGVITDPHNPGVVTSWTDQLHGTVLQATGLPKYGNATWGTNAPTITFSGGQLFQTAGAWSGGPTGSEPPYTILAVLRSTSAQSSAVAAWWDPSGQGYAWAGIRQPSPTSTLSYLDSWRVYSNAPGEAFAGSLDLGTSPHVVAWRYDPTSSVITEVIDGVSTSSSKMPAIGPLPAMPLIVGARSPLPTGLFKGDISELRIVGRALGDDEIQNYMDYSRNHWQITTPPPISNPCINAGNNAVPDGARCDDGNAQTYGDQCVRGTCVGTVPPSGSPAALSAVAWYHANPQEVVVTDGGVSTWFDRTANHLDLMQPFYYGRPTLGSAWPGGKPALHFSGGQGLRRDAWSGSPLGASQPFTILAVFQSGSAGQSSSIASWWNASYSVVSAALAPSNGDSVPSVIREGESGNSQSLTDPVALGTTPHAVVWRYAPDSLTVTVDGKSISPSAFPAIDPIAAPVFLVGMHSYLPTGLFNGDLVDLAIVPRSISDAEVASYDQYVAVEWGGPVCNCPPHAHCVQGASSGLACACDANWGDGGSDCSIPLGSISGQALYQGVPMPNTVITLRADSGVAPADLTSFRTVTDAQGNFQIVGVPANFTYQVQARMDGSSVLSGMGTATPAQGQFYPLALPMDDTFELEFQPFGFKGANLCARTMGTQDGHDMFCYQTSVLAGIGDALSPAITGVANALVPGSQLYIPPSGFNFSKNVLKCGVSASHTVDRQHVVLGRVAAFGGDTVKNDVALVADILCDFQPFASDPAGTIGVVVNYEMYQTDNLVSNPDLVIPDDPASWTQVDHVDGVERRYAPGRQNSCNFRDPTCPSNWAPNQYPGSYSCTASWDDAGCFGAQLYSQLAVSDATAVEVDGSYDCCANTTNPFAFAAVSLTAMATHAALAGATCAAAGTACSGSAGGCCSGLTCGSNGICISSSCVPGGACTVGGQKGICNTGAWDCSGGQAVCRQTVIPGQVAEDCNGLDDNCDGQVDETFPLNGAPCQVAVSECQDGFLAPGTFACVTVQPGATGPKAKKISCQATACDNNNASAANCYCNGPGYAIGGNGAPCGQPDATCGANTLCPPNYSCTGLPDGTGGPTTCQRESGCAGLDPTCWTPANVKMPNNCFSGTNGAAPGDKDGDGVIDFQDACPKDKGIQTTDPNTDGCPDSDGDGVPDIVDQCPSIQAFTSNGCPYGNAPGGGSGAGGAGGAHP
jgi:hypothetical protein